MTATVPALLQPLKDRLAAATEGPWEPMRVGMLGTRVVRIDGEWDGIIPPEFIKPVTPALRRFDDALFIANAPTDQAKLIAAVEAVDGLCTYWAKLGDGDKYYAAKIRAALTQALGGDGA